MPAREEGKQLGRPRRRPLDEDPRFPKVRDLVQGGVLTRTEGARRLRVRYETFVAALPNGGRPDVPVEELDGTA
jgi:hypothetical protein